MDVIDHILNVACVILWVNWRAGRPVRVRAGGRVSSSLRWPQPRVLDRWLSFAGLVAVVGLRSVFYWHIGPEAGWTPVLELGAIALPFRCDLLPRVLLYSVLSFGFALGVFYCWLLLCSAVNAACPEPDAISEMIEVQLGWLARLPAAVQLMLPMTVTAALWWFSVPWLVDLGILPEPLSARHRMQQAMLFSVATVLVWNYFLIALLLMYVINSYVYLGATSFWTFVNTTGRNLLRPLRWLPLRAGRIDLSPLAVLALVIVAMESMRRQLPVVYQKLPL